MSQVRADTDSTPRIPDSGEPRPTEWSLPQLWYAGGWRGDGMR